MELAQSIGQESQPSLRQTAHQVASATKSLPNRAHRRLISHPCGNSTAVNRIAVREADASWQSGDPIEPPLPRNPLNITAL